MGKGKGVYDQIINSNTIELKRNVSWIGLVRTLFKDNKGYEPRMLVISYEFAKAIPDDTFIKMIQNGTQISCTKRQLNLLNKRIDKLKLSSHVQK